MKPRRPALPIDNNVRVARMLNAQSRFLRDLPSVASKGELPLGDDDWEDLASFAFQLVTGFDLPFAGSSDDDTAFTQLNERLDAISKQLDNISNQLGGILNRIGQLPLEIRGIVQEALLTEYLADQRTHVQLLRPYLHDSNSFSTTANFVLAGSLIQELAGDVNRILGNTQGKMAGFALSCSGFAVWAQAMTIALNVQSQNPAKQTIWDQDFFTSYVDMLNEFFGIADALSLKYAKDLPTIPGGGTPGFGFYRFSNNAFSRYNYPPHSPPYVPDVFTTKRPIGGGQDWELYCSYNTGAVPGPHPILHQFLPCKDPYFSQFEHPDLVKAAAALWNNTLYPYLQIIQAFDQEFKDFSPLRDKIKKALQRPPVARRKRKVRPK